MSGKYIEIAGGKITETYKYDYNMYAGGNIILSAGKSVVLHGEENGIVFGEPQDPPELKTEREKYIQKAEWLNEKQMKTKGLAYAEFVYVSVTLLKSVKGKKLEISFKEKTNDTLLKQINFVVSDERLVQLRRVDFTIDDFVKCGNEIGQYVFEIILDEEHYVNASEVLKVFPVIYIPEVMKSMGWEYSFKSQDDWFRGEPIEFPWENQPKLNHFFMGWALKFERIKSDYDNNINKWQSANAIKLLRKRIKEDMVDDGYASLPTLPGETRSFGTFSEKIIQNLRAHKEVEPAGQAMEFMPTYEKYYFQDISIQGSWLEKIFTTFDDFSGSIASCNIRYIASGILERKEDGIEATIIDLGIYFRDGFDYVGEQFLGYWSFKDKKVYSRAAEDSIRISNDSYNSYRNVLRKGSDFYRYSNIYLYHPNYKFML